jgi:hypothetical protein
VLPPGLSLSPSGTISGTPTSSGTFNFTVRVQDNLQAAATRAFSMLITSGNQLIIVTDSLPDQTVNVPYNQTITAAGGTAPYSWSIVAGSLPPGLSLSSAGTITGIPIALGTSTFSVQVHDSGPLTATQAYMVTIMITPNVKTNVGYWSFDDGTAIDQSGMRNDGALVNNPAVVPGKIGQALNLDASAGQHVDLGNNLDPGSGDLSVFAWVKTTQNNPSNLPMIVSKRNSSVSTNPGYQLFQNGGGNLSFTFSNGQSSRVRVDSAGPHINDGNWHLVGVVFTRVSNGVLYVDGAPAIAGSGDITTQGGNAANTLSLRFGVEDQINPIFYWNGTIDEVRIFTRRALTPQEIADMYHKSLVITSNALTPAALNSSYSENLNVAGGVPPYTWSVASGSLPQGMTLSPTGTLSGTPQASGTFNFTARVDDTAAGTTTQALTLVVNSSAPQALLTDNFTGTAANWTIVDEGTNLGPSSWVVSNGDFIQQSDIQGGTFLGNDPVKPGTYAYAGSASWQNYDLSLRVMSEDDDQLGVMFRYQNSQNYYRYSIDNERPGRRLVKVVNGVASFLAVDSVPYEIGQVYRIRISVNGNRIQVFQDGALVFDVLDSSIPAGKVALYCWGNLYSHFGDVLVTSN